MDPKTSAERLKQALSIRGIKQIELSELTGINKSSISAYLSGKYVPKSGNITRIAAALGVDPLWLSGNGKNTAKINNFPGILTLPTFKETPLIGKIACGTPVLAEENIGEMVSVPESVGCDFCLRASGDSMIDARIHDGDIVYIREQPMVENGDIAAVLIDNEATLKRVYMSEDTLTLIPCNSSYAPMSFKGNELNNIRIIGKAVGFTSVIK